MRALVIGGTRFLGKALLDELVKGKFEVSVLNRGTQQINYPAGVRHLRADRNDLPRMKSVLQNEYWDVVYDLICSSPQTALESTELLRDRTTRLVYASSAFVYSYGQNLHEEQFDASMYRIPEDLKSLGGTEARRVMEAILQQKASFKALAVRLPFVFGEGDPTQKLHRLIRRVVFKETVHIPNSAAKFSAIHVEDAAKAIMRLGLYPHEGSVNCAAAAPVQISSLLKLVEEATYCSIRKTDEANADTVTAFSIKNDWYVDTNRLKSFEANPRNVGGWLPELVKQISQGVHKERP